MSNNEKKTIADPEIYTQTRHRDQGYKRVAALLLTLNRAQCLSILKQLAPEEGRGVIREITRIITLTEREVKKVQEEFGYYAVTPSSAPAGGVCTAREMLIGAFGEVRGEELFRSWVTAPEPGADNSPA